LSNSRVDSNRGQKSPKSAHVFGTVPAQGLKYLSDGVGEIAIGEIDFVIANVVSRRVIEPW
jgi:hypothetical protein